MWYQLSPFPSSNAAIAMQHHPGNIHQSICGTARRSQKWDRESVFLLFFYWAVHAVPKMGPPGGPIFWIVLVAQLVSRQSCVADRLPVVVRFPASPRLRLKTVDPPKGNGLGQKKQAVPFFGTMFRFIFWSLLYQGCRSATFWFQRSPAATGRATREALLSEAGFENVFRT